MREELRRLSTEMDRLDAAAATRFGLNRTDLRCLDLLNSHGALRASRLAEAVGLSTGGLSIALRRLEGAGYVRRRGDPNDRRLVMVELTDQARAVEEELFGELVRRVDQALARRPAKELAVVGDFLVELRCLLRAILEESAR